MKKWIIGITVSIGIGLAIGAFHAHAQQQGGFQPGQYGSFNNPELIFAPNNPGFASPGSLWINSTNGVLAIQTNNFNQLKVVITSNWVAVCTASCGTVNALYTNYLGSTRSSTSSLSAWIGIGSPTITNGLAGTTNNTAFTLTAP